MNEVEITFMKLRLPLIYLKYVRKSSCMNFYKYCDVQIRTPFLFLCCFSAPPSFLRPNTVSRSDLSVTGQEYFGVILRDCCEMFVNLLILKPTYQAAKWRIDFMYFTVISFYLSDEILSFTYFFFSQFSSWSLSQLRKGCDNYNF